MPDKLMAGLLASVAQDSDHPRPDFWVWALLPSIGCGGSLLVLAGGVAGRALLGVQIGLWVWIAAVAIPLALFVRDVWHYHTARRRGRRAGWELRDIAAREAATYLRVQGARLAGGTMTVREVQPPRSQRYALLRHGETTGLLPVGDDGDEHAQWLVSPGGRRAGVGELAAFLRAAYRLRSVSRRSLVPDVVSRADYDRLAAFCVDCGLIEDKGQAGRALVLPTLADAEQHLGMGVGI